MSEKVVLPKFDLPGQTPHPAVLAIKIVGGVLALTLFLLMGALWHHHSLQVAAEARAQALVAERIAQAAAEAAKARAAEAQAKAAAAAAKAAAAAAKAAAAQPKAKVADASAPETTGAASEEAPRHRTHHHSSGKSKTVAKAEDRKSSARPTSKRDDAAIDKLLASFNKK